MALGVALREGHLRVQLANRLALKYGVSLVREILANKDGPLHSPAGMTTDEIYKLTLQKTPPANFYNPHIRENKPLTTLPTPRTKGKKRNQPPPPPNPEHPVRSKVFLKKNILEYLAGTQELAKVRAERVLDVSTTSTAKKKGKKDPVSEEGQGKATSIVWVWKAIEATNSAKIKPPLPPKKPFRAELFDAVRAGEVGARDVGLGEDFSHLSTKRQRARLEDIRRDARMLKVRKSIKEQKGRLAAKTGLRRLRANAQEVIKKPKESPPAGAAPRRLQAKAQEGIKKTKESPAAGTGPRRLQVERASKKSRQEQDWEDRRLATRKPLTGGKK